MSTNIDSILQQQSSSFEGARSSSGFLQMVYAWMFGGLLLTAASAYFCLANDTAFFAVYNLRIVLILAELGLVWWLSARITSMAVPTARILYISYAVLSGLTFSAILAQYQPESIISTFVSCALMFGATSVFGAVTKRDLSSMGSFFFMGVLGLIIASLVNMFLQSPALYFAISAIGVLVFVGLTAYDTQKLKEMHMSMSDESATSRLAIIGALSLYLDFVNMFLYLLRLLGRRR